VRRDSEFVNMLLLLLLLLLLSPSLPSSLNGLPRLRCGAVRGVGDDQSC
jgi:hypothetical protein